MSWHRIKPPVVCAGCQKADWCMCNDNASEFLCMRQSSSRPLLLSSGETGWIHEVGDHALVRIFHKPEPRPTHLSTGQMESMLSKAIKETSATQMSMLSKQLGVKVSSLLEMRVGFGKWEETRDGRPNKKWQFQAWFFPMRDGHGRLVGLRTRDWHGNKRAVTGSKGGLFYPYSNPPRELYVCEGASDVAALLSMNLWAIGRASCNSGAADIKTFVEEQHISRVIIIADNDGPGISGAESLSRLLTVPCCLMALPTKDVREFMNSGGSRELLESMANNVVWRNCT